MVKYVALFISIALLVTALGCGNASPSPSQVTSATVTADSAAESFTESRMPSESSRGASAAKSSSGGGFGAGDSSDDIAVSSEPFVPDSRQRRQSGTLTAGSFDDVQNFRDFQNYLSTAKYRDGFHQWPLNRNTVQKVITVKDPSGKPIGNARCEVSKPEQQSEEVLLSGRTGTDGRIMLVGDGSELMHCQSLHLKVWSPDSGSLIVDESRGFSGHWDIVTNEVQAEMPSSLDLALVIDTTGSMGDELEYLKTEIDSIVESVNRMFPGIDQRYSLVTYRDNGDAYVSRSYDFTGSLTDFRKQLDAQSASGGGDFPEAMDAALTNASQLSWRSGNVARVLFLVGDAPPHSENIGKALSAVNSLTKSGVRIFPVGASGVETTAQIVLRTSAFLSMGQYLFLTDHSGIGNAHATPDVPEFSVERLDRLMVRMIASELAGKRLAAQEVLAIEHGTLQTSNIHCTPVLCCESVQNASVPQSTPTQFACVETPTRWSASIVILGWISRYGIAVLVAMVSAVIVFDNLVVRHQNTDC